MKIYEYKDYDHYRDSQIEANKKKIKNSYVDKNSIKYLIDYYSNRFGRRANKILCHGTRRGLEQEYFKKFLGKDIDILGTEISDNAKDYPNTIQWDFHKSQESWRSYYDIVYSNSFDHSYKPAECLDEWMSCINSEGICIIEYSPICDTILNKVDCFSGSLQDYKELIGTKYNFDILTNDGIKDDGLTWRGLRYFFIITNKL
jgi:hypothetical protein